MYKVATLHNQRLLKNAVFIRWLYNDGGNFTDLVYASCI